MTLPDEWTEEQREMFSHVFRFMLMNQRAIKHPESPDLQDEQWRTICHNAAWAAAEFMECDELTITDLDTGTIMASTPKMVS